MDVGTKVKVVKFPGEDESVSRPIVGEVGKVLERRPSQPHYYTRVMFDLPDHRNGEWLFNEDEIEAVE